MPASALNFFSLQASVDAFPSKTSRYPKAENLAKLLEALNKMASGLEAALQPEPPAAGSEAWRAFLRHFHANTVGIGPPRISDYRVVILDF